MSAIFSRPQAQKALRYILAYVLFFAFAGLAFLITISVRGNIIDLCPILGVSADAARIIFSWGTYLLFIPYVLCIVPLEVYMNTAAKIGQVWLRAKKVVIIEGSIGLASVLITLLFMAFGRHLNY
jgi:hypothetical protein